MEELGYIVVGSGCTGAMAAQTLAESGAQVLMLDVGEVDKKYATLIPDKDFIEIRKTEAEQHAYFIGEKAEGVSWGSVKTGEHLTPPRKHVLANVREYLPFQSDTFFPMESLSYGGLGNAWGLGCCEFSVPELTACGLDPEKVLSAYELVAKRIGISAERDDAAPYTVGQLKEFDAAPSLDRNHRLLFDKYQQQKNKLSKNGFYMGRPALALITKDKGVRKKYGYRDMDFYSDRDESAYRPWITINELRSKNNFTYKSGFLVVSFTETEEVTLVHCLEVATNTKHVFKCKKLILAAGVLSTARIVLRSQGSESIKLPLLCNSYSYIPCLQLSMIGKEAEKQKLGFAQLSLFHDEKKTNFDVAMASVYSYQSLMLFRIIKEVPLNFSDSRKIMQYLMSGLLVMGIHHPESGGKNKYIELKADPDSNTGDRLSATYLLNEGEKEKIVAREKKFCSAMRSLGAYPLKRISPGPGSSIHYAGTLPFSESGELFTLNKSGRLSGTKQVFVADGSGFNYLPAKGLTFTLMANAHLVALNALKYE
ncbi:MAG: hypothetical protein M3R27_03730 [Bacteroidota bacterium]|nr:hypothetical protein [Bacteroidota bacterium]